jgi:hypothetical protein
MHRVEKCFRGYDHFRRLCVNDLIIATNMVHLIPIKYTRQCIQIRDLSDGLSILAEESYRLWRVALCDQVTSYARRLKPDRGM